MKRDFMRPFGGLLLLAILSIVIPASAQRMTPEQNARQSQKAAKKQQEMLKKANKKQQKAMKKAEKAQRKANKKANKDLQKRHGR
jgi:hypothetical protein